VRLIAIDTGRSSLLFPLEEIAPLQPVDNKPLTVGIIERYGFKVFPADNIPREELSKNGARFENGHFFFDGQIVGIMDFTVFNDGIVVNSKSTEVSAAFTDDLLGYVRSQFGFREFTSKVRKIAASQVIVEFDTRLAALVPTFNRIASLIAEEIGDLYGGLAPVDFFRLDFQIDREKSDIRHAVPRFMIERRADIPFSQERYYCSALMHTKSHLRVLEQVEKMLVGSPTFGSSLTGNF
jgi:hypothetical protein